MKRLILVLMSLVLSACSTMSSTFECQTGHCQDVQTVNRMVNRGDFNRGEDSGKFLGWDEHGQGAHYGNLRVPERVLRIWIASYSDEQNNWHMAHTLYTVVEHGDWSPNIKKENAHAD